MKICMLIDSWTPFWGGGPAHVWEVSKCLVQNHNCQIDILVPNFGVSRPTSKNPHIIPIGPKIKSPNLPGRLKFLLFAIYYLLPAHYDVYHSHSYLTSLLFPLIKIFKRKRFAFTLHGVGVKIFGGGPLNNLSILSCLDDLIVYRFPYDVLFTVAKSSLTKKPAAKKLLVIGNGVDVTKFDAVVAKKNPKIFKILWVGRFDPVKNVEALVEAITQLPQKVHLTLVGDGAERKNIEMLVKDLNLEDRVTLKGFLTGAPLIKEYKSSNLFVLPSLSEGFPIVLLEAMAAKLPIVAVRVGDVAQIAGSNFFSAQPGNVKSLTDAITKAIKSQKCSTITQKNYSKSKSYSWSSISQWVLDNY